MIIAAICDINERRIPNWLTVGAAGCAVLAWTIHGSPVCAGVLAGLSGLAAASPNLIRSRQVGAGDVKLVAALGALLGLSDTLAMLGVGALLALVALLLIRLRGADRRQPASVAFAPFLLGGFVAVGIVGA